MAHLLDRDVMLVSGAISILSVLLLGMLIAIHFARTFNR